MSQIKGGLTLLKDMLHGLPPSEKKLAEYILEKPEEAIMLTAVTLGKASGTSSAAVIRLCKSLGLKGFQELKIRVAGDLQKHGEQDFRDIEPNDKTENLIEKMTANTIQTIQETVDIMRTSDLQRAANVLSEAKSIVFIGVGASFIAAQDAEQKFIRIDKFAQAFSDVHMGATAIANKGPEDVVVGISFSGETKDVVDLMELAKRKQAKTISITKSGKSQVSDISDIQLHTSAAKEATFRSGATSSRMAQLHVIDILLMVIASSQYEKIIKHLDETRKAISALTKR
ncbi:DNA-binding transcriptional regulator, MurR/RpiR family, contains HTH and SIS domains [Lentibacillus persicus]|uniref:DNA-binding transcriptional regulator, MurR/RpiR family, contains HTH and SIS domains n=1 Tax=Lentibacillus persicus TaxID=640948 RepID=A0A1I2B0R0_9BACI|nr:MurR/RpiR family transcriptional regulator [Lentibacillus persicus]SFE48853.1 DNA-binding transcriptional regulator, MurR/RpiR family, contains HTH and SIS domains [Lentibacillus persicus]